MVIEFLQWGEENPVSGSTFEINIKLCKLIEKSSMLCAKCYHGLCISNAQIYSMAGCIGTKDCEKYSIYNNKWVALPLLQTARYVCAAFVINSKNIYAFGGYIGSHALFNGKSE